MQPLDAREGAVAGLGGGLSSAFLVRSSIGRIDTDQLNLVSLPALCARYSRGTFKHHERLDLSALAGFDDYFSGGTIVVMVDCGHCSFMGTN